MAEGLTIERASDETQRASAELVDGVSKLRRERASEREAGILEGDVVSLMRRMFVYPSTASLQSSINPRSVTSCALGRAQQGQPLAPHSPQPLSSPTPPLPVPPGLEEQSIIRTHLLIDRTPRVTRSPVLSCHKHAKTLSQIFRSRRRLHCCAGAEQTLRGDRRQETIAHRQSLCQCARARSQSPHSVVTHSFRLSLLWLIESCPHNQKRHALPVTAILHL